VSFKEYQLKSTQEATWALQHWVWTNHRQYTRLKKYSSPHH